MSLDHRKPILWQIIHCNDLMLDALHLVKVLSRTSSCWSLSGFLLLDLMNMRRRGIVQVVLALKVILLAMHVGFRSIYREFEGS